jgi:K+-transporting ATPase KdpF subunit
MKKQELLWLFILGFVINFIIIVTPKVVYASTALALDSRASTAFTVLGGVVGFLAIYLFVVIFQPEWF